MTRPRILDLFCCQGGAAMGYHRAGFEIVGVDCEPQPRYPFAFLKADALDFLRCLNVGFSSLGYYLDDFAAIHASPPCQQHSVLQRVTRKSYPCWIEETRRLLLESGKPFVIENVPAAPLLNPVRLCGSSFGLDLRRHRNFECNWPAEGKPCDHSWQKPRFPPNRSDRRKKPGVLASVVSVAGHDTRATVVCVTGSSGGKGGIELWKHAMGIDWMTRDGLAQAIPPAYTEFIGKQLISIIADT